MFIFTVFDKKIPVHKSPFIVETTEDAIRSFYRVANDSRSDLNMFSGDFALYRVGKLDLNSGHVSHIEPIEFVCEASSLIKPVKNEESN